MIRKLPHSYSCFVCGESNPAGLNVRFFDNGDSVFVRYTFDQNRSSYENTAHGGIIMSLLDETMGWAASVANRRFCVLGELKTRFLKRVPLGVPMTIRGFFQAERMGMWFAKGEVADENGEVYVRAEGRYAPISPEEMQNVIDKMVADEDGIDPQTLFAAESQPSQV